MEPSRTSSTAITSSSRLAGGVAAIAAAPTWPCAEMERTSGLMSTQSADGKVPNDSGRSALALRGLAYRLAHEAERDHAKWAACRPAICAHDVGPHHGIANR